MKNEKKKLEPRRVDYGLWKKSKSRSFFTTANIALVEKTGGKGRKEEEKEEREEEREIEGVQEEEKGHAGKDWKEESGGTGGGCQGKERFQEESSSGERASRGRMKRIYMRK